MGEIQIQMQQYNFSAISSNVKKIQFSDCCKTDVSFYLKLPGAITPFLLYKGNTLMSMETALIMLIITLDLTEKMIQNIPLLSHLHTYRRTVMCLSSWHPAQSVKHDTKKITVRNFSPPIKFTPIISSWDLYVGRYRNRFWLNWIYLPTLHISYLNPRPLNLKFC